MAKKKNPLEDKVLPVEQSNVDVFVDTGDKITDIGIDVGQVQGVYEFKYKTGGTINTGNYENVKYDIGLQIPFNKISDLPTLMFFVEVISELQSVYVFKSKVLKEVNIPMKDFYEVLQKQIKKIFKFKKKDMVDKIDNITIDRVYELRNVMLGYLENGEIQGKKTDAVKINDTSDKDIVGMIGKLVESSSTPAYDVDEIKEVPEDKVDEEEEIIF